MRICVIQYLPVYQTCTIPKRTRLHKRISINFLSKDASNIVLKSTCSRSFKIVRNYTFINNQRYPANPMHMHRPTHHGCVLYEDDNAAGLEFIEIIINIVENN